MESVLHAKVDTRLSSLHSVLQDAEKHILPSSKNVNAGYFKDGKLCWISNGSALSILKHGSPSITSFTDFASTYEGFSLKITCCKEFEDNLLVGMATEEQKGLVCLYNYNISKTIKIIEFPFPVTSLEVVLPEGGANPFSRAFSQNLRWLFGVVAVGTEEGHIYLLDLKNDEHWNPVEDECCLCGIEAVPGVVRDVPRLRDEVNQRNAHLAFELIESSHENGSFHYITMDDQIIETFDSVDVSVTSLLFEPRATALFVGFSFGQFHIFSLQDLSLIFSSDTQQYSSAVVRFAFQEPENDPRNFCYLWVVKESTTDDSDENSVTATMHQLMYQHNKIFHKADSIISLYSNLECCSPRYELTLDATLGLNPIPTKSQILQCSTIEHYSPVNEAFTDEEKEEHSTPYISLLILGWESISTGDKSRNVQLVVFDLNRWYVSQMPACYRDYEDDTSYLAFWELDSVLTPSAPELLCLHTPPSSLIRFKSKQHPCPEHFHLPSSLSLTTHILLLDESITCKMTGIQRQVMQYLLNGRLDCLVEPDDGFEQLMLVGLLEQANITALTIERKRELILSAALDHGLYSFISKIISDVASGEQAASGCTLRFILEWAWKTVAVIKDSIDSLCVPIFDCGGLPLDASVHNRLAFHNSQLFDISLIFKNLLRHASVSTEQSKIEMETKVNVVRLIHDYLKVMRWFINARLLPEQLDVPQHLELSEEFTFVYKHQALWNVFKERREELKHLKGGYNESLLMIDGMIGEAGKSLLSRWKKLSENDDSVQYPPPSLMALLDMYYLDTMSDSSKHFIVTYFLLDILAMHETSEEEDDPAQSAMFMTSRNEHLQTVGLFPETFQLKHSTTKLIKAFWLLDHKQFDDSILLFCEAGTERPSLPWQHRRIMMAYLLQGHVDMALSYLLTLQPPTVSLDDVKLHIDIYVQNRLPQCGLETAKRRSDPSNQLILFSHLFTTCHQHNLLKDLFQVCISKEDDELVLKCLQSSKVPHSHEMLVLYHLRKSRYVEAIKSYQSTRHTFIMAEHNKETKQRQSTMSHLIEGYMDVLPQTYRETALNKPKMFGGNFMTKKEVFHAQPLSATLNSRKMDTPLSHSALLGLVLEKSKHVESAPSTTPFRKKPKPQSAISCQRRGSKLFFPQDITSSVNKEAGKQSSRKLSVGRLSFDGSFESLKRRQSYITGVSPLMSQSPAKPSLELKPNPSARLASMLLQTPPIRRKSKVRTPTNTGNLHFDLMTPQSILKVKLNVLRDKSPSLPCIAQNTSTTTSTSHSGSLTSLNKNDAAISSLGGLDSSGSEGDLPEWLQSAMLPPSHFSASHSVGATNRSISKINSMFAIQTPPVKELVKNFRGIDSKTIDTEVKSQSQFTPKKLRFSCFDASEKEIPVASEEVEDRSCIPGSQSNVVMVSAANEDSDVDVTGDDTDEDVFDLAHLPRDDTEDKGEVVVSAAADVSKVESDISDFLYLSSDEVTTPDDVAEVVFHESPDVSMETEVVKVAESNDKRSEEVEDDGFPLHLSESSEDLCSDPPEQNADDIHLFVSSDESNFSDTSIEISEDETPLSKSPVIILNKEEPISSTNDSSPQNPMSVTNISDKPSIAPPAWDQYLDTMSSHDKPEDEVPEDSNVVDENPIPIQENNPDIAPKDQDSNWKETNIVSEAASSQVESPILEESSNLPSHPVIEAEEVLLQTEVEHEVIEPPHEPLPVESIKIPGEKEPEVIIEQVLEGDHNYSKEGSLLPSKAVFEPKETNLSDLKNVEMEEQQPADLPSAENPTTNDSIPKLIQDDKPPPRTPKAIKIIEEPIYILSPPATRTRRKTRIETPKSVKTQSSSAMSLRHTPKSTAKSPERDPPPAFIFSPPTTRRRSQRKRIHIDPPEKEETPKKTMRFDSPPKKEKISSKPPIPTSTKKPRKSPARKAPPTPTRSSARVKLLKSAASSGEEESKEETVDAAKKKSPVRTPSRSLRERKSSRESHDEAPPSVARTSSRRRQTRASESTIVAPLLEEPPVVKNTSSRRKRTKQVPETTVEPPDAPVVTRTSSRRHRAVSKDIADKRPIVQDTSSRRKHTRVIKPLLEETEVISTESEVVDDSTDNQKQFAPAEEGINLIELPDKEETIVTRPKRASKKDKSVTAPTFPIRARRKVKVRTSK